MLRGIASYLTRAAVVAAVTAAILALPGEAAEVRVTVCYRMAPPAAMTVDAITAAAARIPDSAGFFRLGRAETLPHKATSMRLAWDGERLYLLTSCTIDGRVPLKVSTTDYDGEVWADDAVELFVQPERSADYYHFGYNSGGGRADELRFDRSWNCRWQVEHAFAGSIWLNVAAIPLAALGGVPEQGQLWRVNVCRDDAAAGEYSSWSYSHAGYHEPHSFGWLVFGPPVGTGPQNECLLLGDETFARLQSLFYSRTELARLVAALRAPGEADPARTPTLAEKHARLLALADELQALDAQFAPAQLAGIAALLEAGSRMRDLVQRGRDLMLEYQIETLLAKWRRREDGRK